MKNPRKDVKIATKYYLENKEIINTVQKVVQPLKIIRV